MGKFIRICVLGLCLLSLSNTSCKTNGVKSNSPEAVARKFLGHMASLEFDQARKLGTEKTGKTLDFLEALFDLSKEKNQQGIWEKHEVKLELIKVAVDGKTAVVTFKNEQGKDESVDMIKENGKWLVDMKKETPLQL